jgi:outer membrane receptor protein involved in Fe transport
MSRHNLLRPAFAAALGLALAAAPAVGRAEEPPPPAADAEAPIESFFAETTVTATGREADTFEVTTPVTVVPAAELERRLPENAADLMREEPGVDVNGVGPNQARPVIRGFRGLRVLFMEDGLRLNNARRQTDFGEISGLGADIETLSAVEVVRGPMSVLYGSDAVGGVLNLVTRTVHAGSGAGFTGTAEARYGSAGDLSRAAAGAAAQHGRSRFELGGAWREVANYEAPAGRFGDIRLTDPAVVRDTGVQDHSLHAYLAAELAEGHDLALRYRRYRAENTGFGFVDPALFASEESTSIRILYPRQDFDRATLRYTGSAMGARFVDSADAHLYWQTNERLLVNDIGINIGPLGPGFPDSSVTALTRNVSDLDTLGLRTEMVKVMGRGKDQILTYGVEAFRDDSRNTDHSVTTTVLRFPFPPFTHVQEQEEDRANAPNAEHTSWGVFVQDEVPIGRRFKLTGGLRYQNVATRAQPTPQWSTSGLDFSDDNVVGAVHGLFQATDHLHLLAAYGTAFRAPNIIERLFSGPTPEGAGFQILNAELESETGDSLDLGLKYRRKNAYFEAVWFRADLEDGIVQHFLTPAEVAALPPALRSQIEQARARFVVQQRNVDRLRREGVEIAVGYRAPWDLTVGGNYTHLGGKSGGTSAAPVDDQYADKLNFFLRWEPQGRRLWAEYRLRHNGDAGLHLDPGEPVPPVGDELPAFTVHALGAGVTLYESARFAHLLTVLVENGTNELHAEFSNATFFRPEPERSVTASYRVRF